MRRLVTAAAFAWLGVSAWAAASLPPAAQVLVRSEHEKVALRIEAVTAAGQLVIGRVNRSRGIYSDRGPVTVHDAETGALISTALTGDDTVIDVHWTGKWAVASRGPMTKLVSLDDGKTLIEHPHAAWRRYRSGLLSPSAARFMVEAAEGIMVWDVASQHLLATFEGLRAPLIGDDQTFFAGRLIPTTDGRIQTEPVRVHIDSGMVTRDNNPPIYDCGGGLCSPSGEYGVFFLGTRPTESLRIIHNARVEPAWTLDLRRKSSSIILFSNPGVSFSDDSKEVMFRYQAGKHAIGVARWRTSDGTSLSPLPEETKSTRGFVAISPDAQWAAQWGDPVERFPKWIPQSVQKWLVSTAPALLSKLAPEQRIEIIDNRWDRVAAVIPQKAHSVRFSPDSRALLVHNQRELVRYPVPSGHLLTWSYWGVVPSVLLLAAARRRRLQGFAVKV